MSLACARRSQQPSPRPLPMCLTATRIFSSSPAAAIQVKPVRQLCAPAAPLRLRQAWYVRASPRVTARSIIATSSCSAQASKTQTSRSTCTRSSTPRCVWREREHHRALACGGITLLSTFERCTRTHARRPPLRASLASLAARRRAARGAGAAAAQGSRTSSATCSMTAQRRTGGQRERAPVGGQWGPRPLRS